MARRSGRVRRPFWHPVVYPRPAGCACLLFSALLIVFARLLADRALMAVGLALAGLFVLSLVLVLLGWLVPLDGDGVRDDGVLRAHGWRRLVCPRAVTVDARWRRYDQDGRMVADRICVTPSDRGVWRRVGRRVRWIGPFGLWTAVRIVASPAEKVIMPRPARSSAGGAGRPATGVIPDDGDTGLVREYATGDALHLVSWRLSARHERLMVRQKDHRARPRLLIVFDAAPAVQEDYDRAAGVLYGLCRRGRKNGWEVVLSDGRRTLVRASDQDRYCAAVLPPDGDARHTLSATAVRAQCRPGTLVYLVSPGHVADAAGDLAADLRRRGIRAMPVVPVPPRAAAPHTAGAAHEARDGHGSHLSRLVRSVVLPLIGLAGLLGLSGVYLFRLFAGGLWLGAFVTLMAVAVLTAWLPRPGRRALCVLAVVGQILLLALITVCFLEAVAQSSYHSGFVPLLPSGPSGGAADPAGAAGPRLQTGASSSAGGPVVASPSMIGLLRSGAEDFSVAVLPVEADAGQQALLIVACAAVALVVRLLLIWHGLAPFIALVPLACMDIDWQVSGTTVAAWALVMLVACVVLLVWAPHMHRLPLPLPALVSLAVVVSSVTAAPALSQGSPARFDFAAGGGSLFSSSAINPLVDLKRGLTRNSSAVAFTYTSQRPLRFRLATLTDLSGAVWSFDQSLGTQAGLYSPSQSAGKQPSDGSSGRSGSSASTNNWEQLLTADYPSSAQSPYPRLSPYERTVRGLRLLDAADADAQKDASSSAQNDGDQENGSSTSSGAGASSSAQTGGSSGAHSPWVVTADAATRARQKAERDSLSSALSSRTSVRIADLSTRFLPLAGSPQKVTGLKARWTWSRDRVVYNTESSTDSSMRYSQRSLYIPAVSAESQLDGSSDVARMAALRADYRQRCTTVLDAVPDPASMDQGEWADWYRRASRLGRSQIEAWQSCVVDFSHEAGKDAGPSASRDNYRSWFSSTLRNGLWALDDDPDSSYTDAAGTPEMVAGTGAPVSGGRSQAAGRRGRDTASIKALIGRHYRTLPAHLPSAITAVVRQARSEGIRVGGQGANRQIAAMDWLVRYFSDPRFVYSLDAPDGGGTDNLQVVARFLVDGRGYCVHYASALAVLGRALGVPTRIVLGYSPASAIVDGADTDSASSATTYATAQNQLHAWTEAYIDGVGWVPFDVTPGYSDASAAQTSVSADEVARARERGSRTTNDTATDADRRQRRQSRDGGQSRQNADRTKKSDAAGTKGGSSAARGRARARGTAVPPPGDAACARQRSMVVAVSAAVTLLVLALLALVPAGVRRMRRRRRHRLIRDAGSDGSAQQGALAWDSVWRHAVREARAAGMRPSPTGGIRDAAQNLLRLVPERAPFIRLLARKEEMIAFAGPDQREGLRLTPDQADRLCAADDALGQALRRAARRAR